MTWSSPLLERWHASFRLARLRAALETVVSEVLAGPPFGLGPGSPEHDGMMESVEEAVTIDQLRWVAMATMSVMSRRMDEKARAAVREEAAAALLKMLAPPSGDLIDRKELN